MNRLSFERTKRRTHLRLTLERLESRRLMAGLNVFVFADNDGSRSLDTTVDAPAANRLVYVDLDRSGRFEEGEPLAVSGSDGYAKFPHLSAGNYSIGLANINSAQVQTTSVSNDGLASLVVGADTQTLIGSDDLKHVWSISPTGRATWAGSPSATSRSGLPTSGLSLGGPVISMTSVRTSAAGDSIAWALVDRGDLQPSLVRLDLTNGNARDLAIDVPAAHSLVGVALMGDQLVLKLDTATESFITVANLASEDVTIVSRIAVPRGTLIGSPLRGQLAIIGSDRGAALSTLRIVDSTAAIETTSTDRLLTGVQYSPDGRFLFASHAGGGLEIFSTRPGLESLAFLAEAAGPIAVSKSDGRVITGNATHHGELIVWDSQTWRPTGRIGLADQTGPLRGLAVDRFGERVIAATSSAIFNAGLANPDLMSVSVATGQTSQALLGVRLLARPAPLPQHIAAEQSLDEDATLVLNLADVPALAALGTSKLMFAPDVHPKTGTLLVTPTGRLSYRPAANAHGRESAELRVYDGINSSSLLLSLDVAAVNDAPTSFVIDTRPIDEFAPSETAAGFTTVFDVDADAHYVITSSDPRFYVLNGQLLRSAVGELDYEREPIVSLQLTAVDVSNPGLSLTQSVAIPVLNSNDAPTAVGLTYSAAISENHLGLEIGGLFVDDPDGYGDYVYTVSDDRFEVISGQLRIKDGVSLDYETEPRIELTIAVWDPTAEADVQPVSQVISIDVEDENDAPSGISIDSAKLSANESGAYVGLIHVEDEDALDEYTYVVSDPRFIVEGDALRLKDGEKISGIGEKAIPVLVTARDADGNIISQTISVQVVNDAPFQNPQNPLDVDNDGDVYPRDVLILIDMLNRKGPHIIEPPIGSGEGDGPEQGIFIDVNGDGVFSPLDALILINHLNKRGTLGGGEGEASPAVDAKPEVSPARAPSSFAVASEPLTEEVASAVDSPFESVPEAANVDVAFIVPKEDDREELDSELELLLEQLSRERLR